MEALERQQPKQLPYMLILSLKESRRYPICLLHFCPHFSLSRNKNDMTEFSHVSSHSTYKYFGRYHYSFFKNHRGLGGIFPFIPMGTSSSLSLLLLQHVYLKNACVVHELQCVTSSLEWGAAGKSGERLLFSWIWIPHLSFYIDDAAILSSFCLNFPPFQSFCTFLISFFPLTLQLFSLFRYSSFCLFNSFKHCASCSAMKMLNFLNSFSPIQLFCIFIFLKIFLFLPFQLLYTFSFMFSYRNCSAINTFNFLSSFGLQLFNFFIFSAVHSADFALAFSIHTVFWQEIHFFLV